MTGNSRSDVLGAALIFATTLVVALTPSPSLLAADRQAAATVPAGAAAAAKASPELVNSLAKELGSTPEQAAGAAGAMFGVAKSSLKAEDFSLVAKAVPGMDALLKAAPATGSGGAMGTLSKMTGGGGLGMVADSFKKLGLPPELVAKAVPLLTQYVSKAGGPKVASLLAGVLK